MRSVRAAVSALALGAALLVAPATPAVACNPLLEDCDGGGSAPPPKDDGVQSSPQRERQYTTPKRSCTVYASGAGMGSYCTTIGGGDAKTLRERFGDQKLQLCRYRDIPPNIPAPRNNRPDEGRFMLMTCLGNINFDTYSGGRQKTLDISVVFVPNGTDVDDIRNGITDFLWNVVDQAEQLPVPVMVPQPSQVPLVGIPTYFTFKWIDPGENDATVAQGPYAGKANGGPYKEVTTNGMRLRAEARSISIDPNQQGIKGTTCVPGTPYREGAKPADQPADACSITFPRSSASARKLATEPIPGNVDEAFWATVEVEWRISYGEQGDAMTNFGNGFTMRLRQAIPVQEVQAPNQPPAVIY